MTVEASLDRPYARSLMRAWRKLGFGRAAVRSSGYEEDSPDKSFAGIFDSVLNVRRDDVLAAVARVRDSFVHNAHVSYARRTAEGGVIVQKMVPAEWAGVLFTRHPRAGGQALVEMVKGTGDKLVSGTATPASYALGRLSGRLLGDDPPPIDLAPLHALGLKAERLFGRPQDVEWAYAQGRYYVLQSRDITRIGADGNEHDLLEAERGRILDIFVNEAPAQTVLAQAEISELVPRPTPATLSLMEALWRPGGAVDQACRYLRLNYTADELSPPYLVSVFGNLYVNKIEARRRVEPLTPWKVSRIVRSAEAIERHIIDHFEPALLRSVAILEAVDTSRLTLAMLLDLFAELRRKFVAETYSQASVVTLAATILLNEARRALEERNLNPANALGEMPETPMSQALATLAALPREARSLADFLAVFGHRAPQDYELSCMRYGEDRKLAEFTMNSMLAVERPRHRAAMWSDAERHGSALVKVVTRARRFQALKEQVKHHALRELAVLRQLLLAIDRQLELDGGIFQLTLDEIERLGDADFRAGAAALIRERSEQAALFKRVRALPPELSCADLESLSLHGEEAPAAAADGRFRGTLVAGNAPITGRAYVMSAGDGMIDPTDIDRLPADAIIVSRLIHPQWLAWLTRARGLVCHVGGWLSHTAILAREYGLPMIVGVQGLERIRDGDRIRLHADGTVEILAAGEAP